MPTAASSNSFRKPSATPTSRRSCGSRTWPARSSRPRRRRCAGAKSANARFCRRRGVAWVGSPMMQDLTGRVGMPLAFPLQASFDRSKPVGVLVAVLDWPQILQTLQAVRVLPEGQDERGYLVMTNSQGVLLAAPPFLTGWEPGRTRLNALGLDTIGTIIDAPAGSGELEVRDSTYLAGYAPTAQRPDLPAAWGT